MDNSLSNDIDVDQGFYINIAFAKRVLSIPKSNPQKTPYPQLRLYPCLTEQYIILPILASLHKFLNVMPMRPSKKLYRYMWNEVYHRRPERWRRQRRFCLRWWYLSCNRLKSIGLLHLRRIILFFGCDLFCSGCLVLDIFSVHILC